MEKLPLLKAATELAFVAHKKQIRKGTGLPYFFHLSDVTSRAAHYLFDISETDLGMSKDEFLAACMLHDYIEDQGGTYEGVNKKFGGNVARVVLECSRASNHESNLQKFEFLQTFCDKSFASVLLKLADRYCNVWDYLRTPTKKNYASKYALQAYPVYKRLIDDHYHLTDIRGLVEWPNIMSDVHVLQAIINNVYNVDILNSGDQTALVKELVIKNGKI